MLIVKIYFFQSWCRETFRVIAGCLGICALTLSYAAFGGFMFMTVENSVTTKVLSTDSSSAVSYYTNDQGGRRGFIVSVEPAAAKVSSTNFEARAVFASQNSSLLDLKTSNKEIDKARLATVKKLWEITEQMNILYPENWTRIAAQELATFQETMVNVLVKEWQKTVKTQQGIQRAEYKPSIPSRESSKSIETIKKDTKNIKNTQKHNIDRKVKDGMR